jgi:uncharacterized protein
LDASVRTETALASAAREPFGTNPGAGLQSNVILFPMSPLTAQIARRLSALAVLVTALLILPAGHSAGAEAPAEPSPVARSIDWAELLPKELREGHPPSPPPPVHDYLLGESGPAAQQQGSFAVNPALEGERIRLPGFIVPLEVDAAGKITEFLLVPYVGACIHVPPPPPNQIVYVRIHPAMAPASEYAAFWITGQIKVTTSRSALAATAYTLQADRIDPYQANTPGTP